MDKFIYTIFGKNFKAFILFFYNYVAQSRLPGLSMTCIRMPGLSRPGKQFFEIQDFSRISKTCTNSACTQCSMLRLVKDPGNP